MANNDFGKKAVDEVVKSFEALNATLPKTIEGLKKVARTGELPSGFAKSIQEVNKQMKLFQAQGGNLDAATKRLVSGANQYVNVLERERKALERTTGMYNRANQRLEILKKQYRDLAIRKELNLKLTAREAVQIGRIEAELKKYDTALKNVDSQMGVNRRNVGNYGRAFDSLGFSVAQITRESPAFLNSLNTGFMAISNNIPILVDEINKLRHANIQLAAEGKPTVNILRRLGGAIFSWQSAISAAIVALTVLGPKLIDWARGNDDAAKATEEATKKLEDQNKELRENIELREKQLGLAGASVESDNFFGIAAQSEVREILDDIQDGRIKGLEAEARLLQLSNRFKDLEIERSEIIKDQNIEQSKRVRVAEILFSIAKNDNDVRKVELRDQEKLTKLREQQLVLIQRGQDTSFVDQQINEILTQKNQELFDLAKNRIQLEAALNAILKAGTDAEREKIKQQELRRAGIVSLAMQIREEIKLLESAKQLYADNSKEVEQLTDRIQKLQTALAGLSIDVTQALSDGAQKINSILNQSGNDEDEDKLGWKSYFNSLVPLAQNTLRLIQQANRQATAAELAELEKQKNLAIQFAGESTSAREAIEEQYAKRRAEIQRKQAEQEKANTIFSILLNTAQAVVAALPQLGLSIAVGAIGAAQLALASSIPIPEFAEGVRNFGGGLAIVGDGGRSEIIRTPDGKVMKTPSKDTLVNLPKGSDVFSSEDEFNRELTRMLNVAMIDKHQSLVTKPELTKEDLSDVISRLEDTIRNKESFEIIDDERGRRVYKKRLNARTEMLNNRRRIKGKGV